MFNLFDKGKKIFPKKFKGAWLAGDWIEKDSSKRKYLMSYFDKDKYIRYKVGEVVPLIRIGDRIGYYKIIRMYRYNSSMWADFAGWDDGLNYDLIFNHSKKI